MSLVRTSEHSQPAVPSELTRPRACRQDESLRALIGPVRSDFDNVSRLIETKLCAEVATADAVSRYVAKTKGKGIRPALVLLAAKAIGDISPAVRSAAAGIELLQASTLLHDDVIDDSALRRGAPSVNAQWGNGVAVLMGDVLFTHALSLFVDTESLAVMRAATRQTRLMLEGEVFARELRCAPDFREATYRDLIRRKTGALMALATEIGPLLHGVPDSTREHMRNYGELLGMAFQIADDVLDVIGDPTVVGKPTGQDLREGTITLPLIHALDAAPDGEGLSIQSLVLAGVTTDSHWETVRQFITAHRGVDSALNTAMDLARKARTELEYLPASAARTSLDGMLRYVVSRSR